MDIKPSFDDDWLFSSIRDYTQLYMYELQQPTVALAWTSPQTVCVACLQDSGQSEILELKLPRRLLAEGQDQDVCKERDFKIVCGGFHSQSVMDILNVTTKGNADLRLICCSEKNTNTVSLWQLCTEDSDLITKVSSFHGNQTGSCGCTAHMATNRTDHSTLSGGRVVFGGLISDLCVADLESGKVTQSLQVKGPQAQISALYYTSENTVLVSTTHSPQLQHLDTRLKEHILTQSAELMPTTSSSMWNSAYTESGTNKDVILSVSTAGEVRKYDMQDLRTPVNAYRIHLPQQLHKEYSHFTVQLSPFQNSTFSVSGLDGQVHMFKLPTADNHESIHNTSLSQTHSQGRSASQGHVELSDLEPIFIHKGHVVEGGLGDREVQVLNHMWHSDKERMMISSANDGSIHVWQYVDK